MTTTPKNQERTHGLLGKETNVIKSAWIHFTLQMNDERVPEHMWLKTRNCVIDGQL